MWGLRAALTRATQGWAMGQIANKAMVEVQPHARSFVHATTPSSLSSSVQWWSRHLQGKCSSFTTNVVCTKRVFGFGLTQVRGLGREAWTKTHQHAQKRFYSYQITNRRNRFDWRGLDYEPVLYSLLGLNALVFVGWQMNPGFMLKHFAFSTESMRNLRPWTLVTAIFSQYDFSHLAVNMLGLYFWGKDIGRIIGGTRLVALYLVGGVVGNLVQLSLNYNNEQQYRWGQPRPTYGLGASGSVNSIVTLSILLFPKETVLLYFVVPVPAALMGVLFLLRDFSGLYSQGNSGTSHAGHLGGASVGAAYWIILKFFRRM